MRAFSLNNLQCFRKSANFKRAVLERRGILSAAVIPAYTCADLATRSRRVVVTVVVVAASYCSSSATRGANDRTLNCPSRSIATISTRVSVMTCLLKCCVLQAQFYRHAHTLVNDERMLDRSMISGEFEWLSE